MKKTILTIMATVGIMTIGFTGSIVGINNDYENKLEATRKEYEEEIQVMKDEYEELEDSYNEAQIQMTNLENQVYNVMTGKDYDMTVDHYGVSHTWSSENGGTHEFVFQ